MPTRREPANAIRALAMDAVRKVNSGHIGAPMGMADIAEVLWRDVLKFNPGNPSWIDRDGGRIGAGQGIVSTVWIHTGQGGRGGSTSAGITAEET